MVYLLNNTIVCYKQLVKTCFSRFNICKESIEETKAICNEIALKIMVPATSKCQKPYTDMCQYLINGLWPLNPFLEFDSFMFYMKATLSYDRELISQNNVMYKSLKWDARLRLQVILITIDLMKFSLVRIVLNYLQVFAFWLSKRWPFLAYWKYGIDMPVCLK